MKTRYVILFLTTILVGCASVPRGNAVIDNSSSMRDDEGVRFAGLLQLLLLRLHQMYSLTIRYLQT
ncbi:MAG: hypothetical protein RLZZ66_539 [Pseudomonadota bacterium]|jgi:hypothetical protein